jgi:hypothetical protein
VPSLCALLAFGASGSYCLPIHLAAFASVPNHRSRSPRSSGSHLPGNNTPIPSVSRAVPNLVSQKGVKGAVEERLFEGRVGVFKILGASAPVIVFPNPSLLM